MSYREHLGEACPGQGEVPAGTYSVGWRSTEETKEEEEGGGAGGGGRQEEEGIREVTGWMVKGLLGRGSTLALTLNEMGAMRRSE